VIPIWQSGIDVKHADTRRATMSGKIYLRPTGILWGDVARQAIDAGAALPLAGSKAAFSSAEVIEGVPGSATRSYAPVASLKTSAEPAIDALLQHIATPRLPLCGIPLDRTRLMGIVNVTPDSFSDGGDFLDADRAADHARQLVGEGAEIVDIGGESTRPAPSKCRSRPKSSASCPCWSG
jgi:dihydropteroate synthase